MALHRYFAGGCPYTLEGVITLFKHVFAEKCPVMFAFHQAGAETSDRIGKFWTEAELKDVPLPDGWSWSFKDFSSRVLATDELPDIKTVTPPKRKTIPEEPRHIPQIEENILVATRGGERFEIRLYHFDGWSDYNITPSHRLFRFLLTILMRMNVPPETPIAANCRGGVGRTGTFVCAHYLLLQVVEQLRSGVPLEKVRLNVMDTMYKLRIQRRLFVEGKRNL